MPEHGSEGTTRPSWITDELVELAARYLRDNSRADYPIPAIRLANRFDLFVDAKRETRRRRVRELVDALRAADHPIVANLNGIWWAAEHREHLDYQERRRRNALTQLAAAKRDRTSPPAVEAADTAAGQGRLF